MTSENEAISSVATLETEWRILDDWETQGDPDCTVCHGLGWLSKLAPRSRHMVNDLIPCNCRWIRQERERLERYEDFRHMTLENYEGSAQVVDIVRRFARNEMEQRFLVLKGPTGTGKTHLSIAAVREAHSANIVARIAYVSRLFDDMRNAIDGGNTEGIFRLYADTPFLAIDDQGLENTSNWTAERWDYLINERYTLGNKTIIGTNLDTEKIPPRIADRIFDAKYGLTIELKGRSRRGRGNR